MTDPITITELLAGHGIRPRNYKPGQPQKMVCPKCNDQRDHSLTLTVDEDGNGAVWTCHRGKCGWTGGARLAGKALVASKGFSAPTYRPAPQEATEAALRPDSLYEFFDNRAIGPETVDWFKCYVAKKAFQANGEWVQHDCIVWPYTLAGEVVNRKYRALDDKGLQRQEKEPLPTLYNVDSIQAMDEVIWVEGEPDVMALHEAGFRQVVTLKDGAPDKLRDEDDPARMGDKRFLALNTHAELLAGVQKFILAGDKDEPGQILREELARRLGRHRCWTVDWPDGCKDAGDVLRKYSPEALRHWIGTAAPWPIEGVRGVTGKSLLGFRQRPPPAVMRTGIESVDMKMALPTEGRQIVLTGFPNHGKSTFAMNVIVHTAEHHARKWAIFSPEMEPVEEFALQLAQIYLELPARRLQSKSSLLPASDDEMQRAGEWMRNRIWFLSNDSEDEPPTLDMILGKLRDCALRYGITDFLIDPFNEIEQDTAKQTETQFIGRALQRFKAFGKRHGVNQWIIAHPAKPSRDKNGAIAGAPGPYDINGSAHWANKADLGITIHTPGDISQAILWKARFRRLGRKGEFAEMRLDEDTGKYWS
jgi:twinkle protein